MAWTATDLDEIEKAIKTGTLRVKYSDREVQYRSLDEMLKIRDLIAKEVADGPVGPFRKVAQFSKGLGDA
jgi:hypothetical protein